MCWWRCCVIVLCPPPGLFDRALSQPALSDLGILVVTGVQFDVSGQVLYPGGDSVRAGPRLLVSVDTGDGDRLPTGSCLRVLWLAAIRDAGGRPVDPPISMRARTVVLSQGGRVVCIWIVYTWQGSVEVLQVTGSLLLRVDHSGCLSQNRQSGEVVPAMDSDAISVECGVEAECVGHIYRRGAFQRTWGPAGPPLLGVRRLCFPCLSAWDFHGRTVGVH